MTNKQINGWIGTQTNERINDHIENKTVICMAKKYMNLRVLKGAHC